MEGNWKYILIKIIENYDLNEKEVLLKSRQKFIFNFV